VGWAFFYQSREYVETGRDELMLTGPGPVLVDRRDGSIIPTGSADPIEISIERYEDRRAWQRKAREQDRLTSDAVEILADIGSEGSKPIGERLRARHPLASRKRIDEAARDATVIWERARELTHGNHDSQVVAATLESDYPKLHRPIWPWVVYRAEYWWKWEI